MVGGVQRQTGPLNPGLLNSGTTPQTSVTTGNLPAAVTRTGTSSPTMASSVQINVNTQSMAMQTPLTFPDRTAQPGADKVGAALEVVSQRAVFNFTQIRSVLQHLNMAHLEAKGGASLQDALRHMTSRMTPEQRQLLSELGIESMNAAQLEQFIEKTRPIMTTSVDTSLVRPVSVRLDAATLRVVSDNMTSDHVREQQEAHMNRRAQFAAQQGGALGNALSEVGQTLNQTESLTAVLGPLNSDVPAFLDSIRKGNTMRVTAGSGISGANTFDVNAKLNYAVLTIVEAEGPKLTQLQDLESYADSFRSSGAPGEPSPQQAEALKAVGLAYLDGQIVNLLNDRQVHPNQVLALADLAKYKRQSVGVHRTVDQPAPLPKDVGALGTITRAGVSIEDAIANAPPGEEAQAVASLSNLNLSENVINLSNLLSEAAQRARDQQRRNEELKAGTAAMERSKADVDAATAAVKQLETRVDTLKSKVDRFEALKTRLMEQNPDNVSLTPEEIDLLNEMGHPQLRVVSRGSQLSLTDGAGTLLSRSVMQQRLQEMLELHEREAGDLETQLAAARDHLNKTKQTHAANIGVVEDRIQEVHAGAEALNETVNRLKAQGPAALQEIEQLLASPEGQALPPEVRTQLQGLVTQYRSTVASADHTLGESRTLVADAGRKLTDSRQSLDRAEKALEAADRALERVRQARQQLRQLISDLPALFEARLNRLFAVDPARQRLEEELAAKLKALLEQANQLEATLNLAPRPADVDLEKIFGSWEKDIKDIYRTIEAREQLEADTRQAQNDFTTGLAGRTRRELDHHRSQLENMRNRSQEQIERLLRGAIQGLRGPLTSLTP